MRTGRPTTLTPEVQELIIEALRKGNYRDTAAALAGVTRQTLWNWEQWGKEGRAPYKDFFDALEMAEAQAEATLLEEIRTAAPAQTGLTGPDLWQAKAWLMERRWPKRWAQRVRTAVTEEIDAAVGRMAKRLDEATMQRVNDALREDAGGDGRQGQSH